ncbi:hypothetical protein Tsubulata_029099 [Turnera subulata]|uniref:RAVE complex protein Rav1 C-terminal domain-containing protein n=1 Tax=Turnera subulata TaxID=218843 RepID=A0A9Q0F6E8_9ROSI|nr:hypothetical protein Tsubulata_029099 [Turnera subulata]
MAETSSASAPAIDHPVDHHLPLSILRSDTVPPAPTRSGSTIDWIPDFAGYSWVAYGASSLLVISHLPSPLSPNENLIGPILRQVFELSGSTSSPVTAVSWSPVTPSIGELAAASDNAIFVFSHNSASSKGSFCWSQNAVLVQSTKVEAIAWSGSGDGIVAGGIEVVLWRRRNRSWEIAWKFKREEPQSLVSSTWSIKELSATAAYPAGGKESHLPSKDVFVCYGDGISEYGKIELTHPQPVSMIQWRPSSGRQSAGDAAYTKRHCLLTCCFDGTVRLWTEVDNGKARKPDKDHNDHKPTRKSFCVSAVLEINQVLRGTLGVDVHFSWAIEIGGIYRIGEDDCQFFSTEGNGHDSAGRCEWLVGFGPGTLVTFWSIHCLDDFSPVRFPRVTLWKRQDLQDLEVGHLSNVSNWLLLKKVVIARDCLSGPPSICSLIHLLPCSSLNWSLFYTQPSRKMKETSFNESKIDKYLLCSGRGTLDGGHTGKILQVAMHPHIYGAELAVTLDSEGLLLFWSLAILSNCNSGAPSLIPKWKNCGKLVTGNSCSRYTSLRWASSVLDDEHVLLMGHAGGIDLFIVQMSEGGEEKIVCHYVCTIPLTGHGPFEDGPADIFAIPLRSTCKKTFKYNKLLLLAVWMNGFQAISWEVTLHSSKLQENSCECKLDDKTNPFVWKFSSNFSNRKYWLGINPSSSKLPKPYLYDQITSFSVVGPDNLTAKSADEATFSGIPAYVMATGCSDGSLKLWRSNTSNQSTVHIPWEFVGTVVAHRGSVNAICLSDCGRKIATVCAENNLDSVAVVHIWDTVHLIGIGSFILEDSLSINGYIVSLNWLALGNGQLLLGVCTRNELLVYVQKHSNTKTLLNPGSSSSLQGWSCIAMAQTIPAICGFQWGPQTTAVLIHDSYLSLLSQWTFAVDSNQRANISHSVTAGDSVGQTDKAVLSSIFVDLDIGFDDFDESHTENATEHKSVPLVKLKSENASLSSYLSVARAQLEHDSSIILSFWSLVEIAEKFGGTLPLYHPEALLVNIFSGYWKRAYVSLRHLVDCLTSSSCSVRHLVPQVLLSNYFGGLLSKDSTNKKFQWSADLTSSNLSSQLFAYNSNSDTTNNIFSSSATASNLSGFIDPLERLYDLAALTKKEMLQICTIIDLLGEIQSSASAYENLDESGRRFWVALRFQQLHFFRSSDRLPAVEELEVDAKLMCWAFHSDCQETLFTSFLPNEPSWKEMRTLGIGFWFTNIVELRRRMEKLARLQYLKKKDPKDCAFLYIALNRLQVLAGLFKISKDERDKPLVGFLSRNFQEEKNKAAALKNAYVLMSRHQLELASAFFLLGGDTYSAITVCAKNLGDEQLALVVCRLIEGRGGPLERYTITKFILPSAIERGDYWLASLLEWELGSYSQSFQNMVGIQANAEADKYALSSNHVAFMDPHIGLYCRSLATTSCMKNAIGEQNAAVLARWGTFMASTAFRRCGLPLEALECLSSAVTVLGVEERSISDADAQVIHGILKPLAFGSSNWLLGDVTSSLEFYAKLDLALQYFSKLTMEHPVWHEANVGSIRPGTCSEDWEIGHHEKFLQNFRDKLYLGLAECEQKFSVVSSSVIQMILVWLHNNGLFSIEHDIVLNYSSQVQSEDKSLAYCNFKSHPLLQEFKAIEDVSVLISRFIASCSITSFQQEVYHIANDLPGEVRSTSSNAQRFYFHSLIQTLWSLKAAIRTFSSHVSEDVTARLFTIFDLFEYYVYFASAWLQRNSKGLLLMVQPLFMTLTNGNAPYEVDMRNLKSILRRITELLASNLGTDDAEEHDVGTALPLKKDGKMSSSFPGYAKWNVIGSCLWQHMCKLVKQELHLVSNKLEDSGSSGGSNCKVSSWGPSLMNFGYDGNSVTEKIASFSLILSKFLVSTLVHVSSYHMKLLGLCLQKEVENMQIPTIAWLEESRFSHPKPLYQDVSADIMNSKDESSAFSILWDSCADPELIFEGFLQEKIIWTRFLSHRFSKGWRDVYKDMTKEQESEEILNHEVRSRTHASGDDPGSPVKGLLRSNRSFLSSWQKDAIIAKEMSHFENAKEVCKRDGELLEALCVNSTNEWQAAVASNRKGIVFFSWEDGRPYADQSNYIWSDADWPQNGWAGAESTPVPTCVSPGVGLGSKKGTHLGLGGATIGLGSSARPKSNLNGNGAFGIPGYAGMGASSLGWGVQEEFEELVDRPATVENISTRALSSHPSRPFFLVGSSNTHIYLWEFGKDKATATYGVLPAANVPPPYALASISALQFDHCGHRFSTAALDGTVCTWQLEVGGRSNISPTESSLCFNGHASDVTYITSSGSVIAATGHNSNGVNVVIWDTLAPPTTSRASIICHEGGGRSISVFDNDIGSGSISPLIVTGGRSGDVGLHDFRYIATGRTKRHRHFDNGNTNNNTVAGTDMQAGVGNKLGDQNLNGMLWYIPKAHLGSVTKICTIPHTSLFLTGSKDGDVKLWDAKAAKLVCHWPKLHERRTFLQPSSRGFGGVVRAAVTDIQVVSNGFLSCGGDGSVRFVQIKDYQLGT